MRCTKCGSGNREGAKFCSECATPFAAKCPRCGAVNTPGAKFCDECAAPLSGGASVASAAASSAEAASTAPKIRVTPEQPDASTTIDGERKTVTALFADIKGSTELMEELDPEEARAIIDPALKLMIDAAHRYDGYFVQSPVQVLAQRLIEEYLALAGHAADNSGPVFRPVTNNRTGDLDRPLDPAPVYRNIVLKYGLETGISAEVNGLCVHSLRATAATNALSHEADIAKVQE
jgi:Double zinc ribbon